MKQYTEMGFLIILKMHIPAITFEIVTGLSKIKKKKVSAATENYLHVHFKVDTSSSSVSSMLAPEWTVLAKLNLALFNIVFGVAFTMNQ